MKDFIERFLAQAEKTPQNPAVTDDGRELSYAELVRRSGSLASLLHRRGLPEGGVVCVLVTRQAEIVVGAIAAMRAGGVYMPGDTSYPSDRLSYMLKDSSASVLLTTKEVWKGRELDYPEENVVFFDDFGSGDDETFDAPAEPDARAYILYTSGTTGRPKGVVHTRRSLAAMVQEFDNPGFSSTGVVAGFTFIASVFMMFPPLAIGGVCNIVPESVRFDMLLLNDYVEHRKIRQLFLSASLAASMAEEFALDGVTIFSAGEKLRNFKKKGNSVVINAYGSTEGVVVLCSEVTGEEFDVPLGAPCDGVTVRVVDDSLNEVHAGKTGELIYSSDIMAKCYLGLEEQTAEKWVNLDGCRWYRTGDRVSVDGKGLFHYVGRSDNMVKLRGFRVETGEVENCIREVQPGIADLAVVLRTVHGIDHLCCYYNATITVDSARLKTLVSERLAEYMVPDIWVYLKDFPRNSNGKVLRSSLPEPSAELDPLQALYSEVELRVEEAARLVLGYDAPIDIDDNFITLGGDSLLAMKLSSQLAEQGIKISGSKILRLKILRRIAASAEVAYERLWSPEQYASVKFRFSRWGEKILKVLPLSPSQDDMLYGELIRPDGNENRIVYALDIECNLTFEELATAVDNTALEIEELRSAIVYQGVSVFQQVITDRRLPVSCVDFSFRDDKFALMADLCDRMKNAPVDLEQSAAMEVVFVGNESGGCLLFRVLHLSLGMDVVRRSIASILKELQQYYPDDDSLEYWVELLNDAVQIDSGGEKGRTVSKTSLLKQKLEGAHEEIAVFCEPEEGQKNIVFVHTGNSGSDAYYQLANKLDGLCGFSVIEPFNLYNPDDAIDGIKNIAAKYVEILRSQQSSGPYFLGGWCYGGVVAYEMACQLVEAGEKVEHLVMLDSQVNVDQVSKKLFNSMSAFSNRDYFETSPLFADLRAQGLLESMVSNSRRVVRDLASHVPSEYSGEITFFKPQVVPAGIQGESLKYWEEMMKHKAGGFEAFCKNIKIIQTPHEHDLMMDEDSLAIIVPEIKKLLNE